MNTNMILVTLLRLSRELEYIHLRAELELLTIEFKHNEREYSVALDETCDHDDIERLVREAIAQ